MSYVTGIIRAADTTESPPSRPIATPASMRLELGLGDDASFDQAISEVVLAAQEWATEYLGYSPVPDDRIDYFPSFADGLELSAQPDPEEALTVRYLDSTGARKDFTALSAPISDRNLNKIAYFDQSDYLPVVALSAAGVAAAQAIGSLDASVRNPVIVGYAGGAIRGKNAIRLAIKKLAAALFAQSPTQPADMAYRQAMDALQVFRKGGGFLG